MAGGGVSSTARHIERLIQEEATTYAQFTHSSEKLQPMTLSWFRFYHEALDDPKVQKLDPATFKHWVNLLCLACRNDGRFPSNFDIAFNLRIDEIALESLLDRLVIGGLIDVRKGGPNGSYIAPHGWEKRQFKSDSSSDRVKRYRQRSKNVTETPPDTDTDTDQIIEPKGSCPSDDEHALKPEHFVEAWNNLADRLGKPKIRKLTPERRIALKARINGYTVEEFQEVLGNIETSPFLRGDRGWPGCTFDWITKKANFQKILEGNYNG